MDSPWSGFFEGKDPLKVSKTGIKDETLTHIGKRFSSPPPNAAEFVIHRGTLMLIINFVINISFYIMQQDFIDLY